MNGRQKFFLVACVALLGASLLAAPFSYYAVGGIVGGGSATGTLFRPIIDPPSKMEIVDGVDGHSGFIESAELNVGALGLIWAAIITVCGVAAALSGGANSRKCPSCAEMIRPDAVKCRYCGSVLPGPQMISCLACGAQYEADRTGCNHCGAAKPKPRAADVKVTLF